MAATSLEGEKIDLIAAMTTSVTLAAKRATTHVPIVFYAGTDRVSAGLVESFPRRGGRLTGIHRQSTDLTSKRLEVLKEMIPGVRRVVTFYCPDNPAAHQAVKVARDSARQLKLELIERPVAWLEELAVGLRALQPGEADAFFSVSGAMVTSQTELVIATTMTTRLPTATEAQRCCVTSLCTSLIVSSA